MSNTAQALGMVAGIISFVGALIYALTIAINGTKPFRATWVVFLVQGLLIAYSYKASGGSAGVWKAIADPLGYFVILAIIGLRGKSGWTKADFVCIIFALLGIVLWKATGDPTKALYLTLLVDFVAWIPTFVKTLAHPETEYWPSWAVWSFNALITLIAVILDGDFRFAVMVYPVYFLTVNTLTLIASRRKEPAKESVQKG